MSERVGGDKVRKFFKDRSERKSASEQAREWAERLRADRDHDLRLGDHQTSALATLLETLAADNERKDRKPDAVVTVQETSMGQVVIKDWGVVRRDVLRDRQSCKVALYALDEEEGK